MRSRVYETVLRPSVCLSVCPSHTAAARRYCEFAVVSPAAKIYRSIAARPVDRRSAAAAPQLRAVAECIKRQYHVVTKLTNQQNHKLTVPFLPARRYASAGTSYGPVSGSVCQGCRGDGISIPIPTPYPYPWGSTWGFPYPRQTCCLCLSQVGVLSKRMNESGLVLAWELLSTYRTLCFKEI